PYLLLGVALSAIIASAQQQVVTTAAIAPRITGVSHLSVYAADPAKSDIFYTHDLGAFKASDPQNPTGARYYFNPLQFIEVLPLQGPTSQVSRFDHAAYNVSDAGAMRGYLAAKGIAVPDKVANASDGARYFEIKDPEGNRIQFIQAPARAAAVPQNELSAHIIHVGYIVHDVDKEVAFYRDILGFRPYWHGGPTEDSNNWTSMQVPNGTDWVELMKVTGEPTQSAAGTLNHFSLGVANIERATDILFNGNRFTGRNTPAPKIGRDAKWQLNMFDPDGTRAEIMEFQPIGKPCCSPFLLPSPTQ
ncbi:MAG TPA: VOC family protein, partial [Acidobacteriaceae bacterium]|nr:VOC family protein [Acidobacteriaceae bacterium]